jgi:hypothetical protein
VAEDLKQMIVHDLVDRRNRSDIVEAVCQRAQLDWSHAEELVKQVELEQAHSIASRQTPVLVFLSACTSAAGLLLIGYTVRLALDAVGTDRPLLQALLLLADSFPLWLFVIGLSMLAGGILGMYRTMLRYFET